jgi:hypothetical protein
LDSQFGPILVEANSKVTMRRSGERMVLNVDLGTIDLGDGKRTVGAGESVGLEIGGVVIDVEPKGPKSADAPAPTPDPVVAVAEPDLGDGVRQFDLQVGAGASFVVHDPSPPSAVGISVGDVCKGPARLTVGKLQSEGQGSLGFRLPKGQHRYEVRCLDSPNVVAAKGEMSILSDAGTRPLPTFTPLAKVATDGRKYTVLYQEKLPQVALTWPSAPSAGGYTIKVGGRTIKTSSPSYTFQSGALRAGTHQIVFAANTEPPRQSRTTTLTITYDTQAPAARVSDPPGGFAPGEPVKVAGQALPGWSVSVGGKAVEMDSQRKFSTEVSSSGAVPIAFSHPTHGTHYYLRRPKTP